MKTVSFLIPTRNNILMLTGALVSITDTCSGLEQIEILLRIDDDDEPRLSLIAELQGRFNVRCVVGPRGDGYRNMGTFVKDLVDVADSKWCWLFDDDAFVSGDWLKGLNGIVCDPLRGPAANAENYVLGPSNYKNGPFGGPVGLILPTEFAKTIGHQNPVDQQWLDIIMRKGWTIAQLPGVTYYHDGRKR